MLTNNSMIDTLKVLTGEQNEDVLNTYLKFAGTAITNRCYPFAPNKPVPVKYQNRQLEITVYLLNKRGAEGETTHNENGINRTYESASVPESMLKDIVPYVGVIGEESKDEMFTAQFG